MLRKVLILGLIAFLLSCAATDPRETDTTPPLKPIMIQHLGTAGDFCFITEKELTDDNNGIDAVSEGNWIRIQWERLLDIDISKIEVYRFTYETYQLPTLVETIRDWRTTEFVDPLLPSSIGNLSAIETDWHYFIRAIDHAGNYTDSDSVNFRLIEKPGLQHPPANAVLTNAQLRADNAFIWRKMGRSTRLRLLIFDEAGNLVWKHDELHATEEIVFNASFRGVEDLPPGEYHWRVDSRGDMDYNWVFSSGSKSEMRRFYVE
jgi:hypothetical protein